MKNKKSQLLGFRAAFIGVTALLLITLPVSAAFSPDLPNHPSRGSQLPAHTVYDGDPPVFDAHNLSSARLAQAYAAGDGPVGAAGVGALAISTNAPSNLKPINQVTLKKGKTSVTTSWKLPAGAFKSNVSMYYWQISWDPTFPDGATYELHVTTTKVKVVNLFPDSHFYWRVSALYSDASLGNWSQMMTVNIPKTKVPSLSSPKNKAKLQNANLTFRWSKPRGTPASGNYYYVLQLTRDPSFTVIDYVYDTLTTNSMVVSVPVPAGLLEKWYWRVKVTSSDGTAWDFSDFSPVRYFLR